MKFLYDQLGDWYLAMAAYDWGAGNVQRAVQKTGYGDFWELYKRHELPRETENYVPQILAAIIIANNPTQYGFDDVTLDPPILTDTVTVNYSVNMRLVSDLVGAPVSEVLALNPSLLRMVTPPDSPFDLHLPAGTATLFNQRIAAVPEDKRGSWRYHTVVEGDSIASIAREYRVEPAALAKANQLKADDGLEGVQAVVIPLTVSPSRGTRMYTVRRGDTLITIADRFGVSLAQLRTWNHISGSMIRAGHRIHVAEPAVLSPPPQRRRTSSSASSKSRSSTSKKAATRSSSKSKSTAKSNKSK
jgi:membrane-bound lytic murein transglycosylase D